MKVIYVTSESYIDHGYTIIKELDKHIELKVYLQAKEITEEISIWLKKLGAEFIKRKRFRNPLSFFSEISFLLKLRKQKPDLVWFNTLTIYQVFLVKILIRNFLVVMHDVELHPESKERHGSLSTRLTLKYYRHNVCAVSKMQAELFRKNTGISPFIFQLPVIDYYEDCAEKLTAEIQHGNKPLRFFFFGSVEAYKGIEILIEACRILELRQNIPAFRVAVYGKLKYNTEELQDKISKLKHAELFNRFVDYREIHQLYKENDVLILPYKQVTQCGPLLIGFNARVPSVCSDLPGFREYVDDGTTGQIFNNTPEGLAEKMEYLILNPGLISEMKKNIGFISMEKFSMKYLYKDYIRNFEEACKNQA